MPRSYELGLQSHPREQLPFLWKTLQCTRPKVAHQFRIMIRSIFFSPNIHEVPNPELILQGQHVAQSHSNVLRKWPELWCVCHHIPACRKLNTNVKSWAKKKSTRTPRVIPTPIKKTQWCEQWHAAKIGYSWGERARYKSRVVLYFDGQQFGNSCC